MIDLHTHTTASDGTYAPATVVRMAAEAGLVALGVTDHDTVAGLPEAADAARHMGIRLAPGIELSLQADRPHTHVLGYFVRYDGGPLVERLAELQHNRASRNQRMYARLAELGVPLTAAEVRAASGGGQVGRPHMAAAMVRKGYVASLKEAFDRYLDASAPGYVAKDRITLQEGIDLIHAAGGLAVLAHPHSLKLDFEGTAQAVRAMAAMGLDGVEAYYSEHAPEFAEMLCGVARETGLDVTGGSDFHGEGHGGVKLGHVIGSEPAPTALLDALAARHARAYGRGRPC